VTGRREYYKSRLKQAAPGIKYLSSDWQDRQHFCLLSLIEAAPVFNRDIEKLRATSGDYHQKAVYIVKKYAKFGLRPYALPMVAHYIEHDKVNQFYMHPGVVAVSTKENIAGPDVAYNDFKGLKEKLDAELAEYPDNRVYLIIHPDARKEDITEWLDTWYEPFLKKRLEALDPTRPKRTKTPNLDNLKRDMDLYERVVVNGEDIKAVADSYTLDVEHARVLTTAIEKKLIEPQI
jgi:hypothetical protein